MRFNDSENYRVKANTERRMHTGKKKERGYTFVRVDF